MARRVYDDETKRQAIALAVEFGPAEASRLTGIKGATIRAWCHRAGVATVSAERMRDAVEASKLSMDERRARLADQLMHLAELGAEHAEPLMAKASLRELVGAWDYAIKNAQLLSGGATSRSESLVPPEAITAKVDELEQRREKRDAA